MKVTSWSLVTLALWLFLTINMDKPTTWVVWGFIWELSIKFLPSILVMSIDLAYQQLDSIRCHKKRPFDGKLPTNFGIFSKYDSKAIYFRLSLRGSPQS